MIIIPVILILGVFIWAIVSNAKSNADSISRREDIRFKLNQIKIGMTKAQVVSILGKGQEIDYYKGQEIQEAVQKNERRGYMSKNMYMSSNPYYSIKVPYGYECIYYGGETYNTSYNGYRQTDTRTYWGIGLYFKDGILEYIE